MINDLKLSFTTFQNVVLISYMKTNILAKKQVFYHLELNIWEPFKTRYVNESLFITILMTQFK